MRRTPEFEQPSGGPLGVPGLSRLSSSERRRQVPSSGPLALPQSNRREDLFAASEARQREGREAMQRQEMELNFGPELGGTYADFLLAPEGTALKDTTAETFARDLAEHLRSDNFDDTLSAAKVIVDLGRKALSAANAPHIEPRF